MGVFLSSSFIGESYFSVSRGARLRLVFRFFSQTEIYVEHFFFLIHKTLSAYPRIAFLI
jgi:hypothetical protein